MVKRGDELTSRDASKVWKRYPDTAKAVKALIKSGWSVVRSGKHYRAWCPCEDPQSVRLSCTPQNDSTHARRVRDTASKCPDRHEYMR